MAFRLNRTEPVVQGLRRISREEIGLAIRHLRKTNDEDRDEAIHEARKCVKKLRGVIRLLRPVLGKAAVRDNLSLQNTGRALSEFRDAAALVETVDALLEKQPAGAAVAQLETIRGALVRQRGETVAAPDPRPGAIGSLGKLRRLVNLWRVKAGDFSAIAPGLKATYRRGRQGVERARRHPTEENFHTLRKRVKDHWYHVRLLQSVWPPVTEAREAGLKELQEHLGDDHNLSILLARLREQPEVFGSEAALGPVIAIAETAREELRAESLAAAVRLYEQKPGQYVRRMGNLWEAWQSQSTPERRQPISTGARRRRSVA